MNLLTIVRVVAVVCAGLLAGIYLGYRTGDYYALQKLSPSNFVQFQQVVHMHFARLYAALGPDYPAGSAWVARDGKVAKEIGGVLAHRSVQVRNSAHCRDDSRCERSA